MEAFHLHTQAANLRIQIIFAEFIAYCITSQVENLTIKFEFDSLRKIESMLNDNNDVIKTLASQRFIVPAVEW